MGEGVDRMDGNAVCAHCRWWEAPTAASPVLRGNTLSRCLRTGARRSADDACGEWAEKRQVVRVPWWLGMQKGDDDAG
jgi:hypothetical protein